MINLFGDAVDLIEVSCADELLDHCEMRVVRCVESEALREGFKQTAVVDVRMPNHCRIGLQRDVDRHDRIFLRLGRPT